MSTKLYNGYRMTGVGNDLGKLAYRLRKWGEAVRTEVDRLGARLLAEMSVEAIDATALNRVVPWLDDEDERRSCPLLMAALHVNRRHRQIQSSGRRDPEIDFECNACVIPHASEVYAVLYTEQARFRSLWEEVPGVLVYPYWDNTDAPDGVSDKAWSARGREWGDVLGRAWTPGRVGMTFNAAGDGSLPWLGKEEVAKHLPSFDQRVGSWTEKLHRDQWCSPKLKAAGDKAFHVAMEILRDFEAFRSTPEGQAEAAPLRAVVTDTLSRELTAESLVTELKVVEKTGAQAP